MSKAIAERVGENTPAWRRVAVAAVVVVVVATPTVAFLTALTVAESGLVILGILAGMGLVGLYLGLPLGADLTSTPVLGVAVAIAGVAAAIGGVVLATQYGLGLVPNATVVATAGGAYLLGITLVGLGVGSIPTYRDLQTAHGPDPGDARPGRVAIGGSVEPLDVGDDRSAMPFEAPFSGANAVCLTARVTERSEYERQGKDLLLETRRTVPFRLQGATGRVTVDPESADLRLALDLQTDVASEDVPADVAAYLESHDVTPRPENTSRTFIERRLEPGEAATVIGEASREHGRLVVTDPIIEDDALEETMTAYRTAIVRGVGGGVALAVVGFGGLLIGF